MNNKVKSIILDLVQFGSLLFFIFTGPVFSSNFIITALQVSAAVLIVLAVWEMRLNRFYRVPDVGKQDRLVTTGIYQYIRHPMYTAQTLFTGALLVNYFSFLRLGVFVLLFVNFLFKIRYEENLLGKYFANYQEYKKKSFRLIPFIF